MRSVPHTLTFSSVWTRVLNVLYIQHLDNYCVVNQSLAPLRSIVLISIMRNRTASESWISDTHFRHTHIHTRTLAHTQAYAIMHAHVHAHTRTHIHPHTHATRTRTHTQTKHTHTHTRTHTRIQTTCFHANCLMIIDLHGTKYQGYVIKTLAL